MSDIHHPPSKGITKTVKVKSNSFRKSSHSLAASGSKKKEPAFHSSLDDNIENKKLKAMITQAGPGGVKIQINPLQNAFAGAGRGMHIGIPTFSPFAGHFIRTENLLPPQSEHNIGRKTLILDLDETLVHSSFQPVENADIVLPVEIDGKIFYVYVLKRPFVDEFIQRMAETFEVVIYTASLAKYADPLLDQLDSTRITGSRLFREHCTFYNNAFVKDLSRLGRDLKNTLIVDNSPASYIFQPENGIPSSTWLDDMKDDELRRLAPILEEMAKFPDVRTIVRKIVKNDSINYKTALSMVRTEVTNRESKKITLSVGGLHPSPQLSAWEDVKRPIINGWTKERGSQQTSTDRRTPELTDEGKYSRPSTTRGAINPQFHFGRVTLDKPKGDGNMMREKKVTNINVNVNITKPYMQVNMGVGNPKDMMSMPQTTPNKDIGGKLINYSNLRKSHKAENVPLSAVGENIRYEGNSRSKKAGVGKSTGTGYQQQSEMCVKEGEEVQGRRGYSQHSTSKKEMEGVRSKVYDTPKKSSGKYRMTEKGVMSNLNMGGLGPRNTHTQPLTQTHGGEGTGSYGGNTTPKLYGEKQRMYNYMDLSGQKVSNPMNRYTGYTNLMKVRSTMSGSTGSGSARPILSEKGDIGHSIGTHGYHYGIAPPSRAAPDSNSHSTQRRKVGSSLERKVPSSAAKINNLLFDSKAQPKKEGGGGGGGGGGIEVHRSSFDNHAWMNYYEELRHELNFNSPKGKVGSCQRPTTEGQTHLGTAHTHTTYVNHGSHGGSHGGGHGAGTHTLGTPKRDLPHSSAAHHHSTDRFKPPTLHKTNTRPSSAKKPKENSSKKTLKTKEKYSNIISSLDKNVDRPIFRSSIPHKYNLPAGQPNIQIMDKRPLIPTMDP